MPPAAICQGQSGDSTQRAHNPNPRCSRNQQSKTSIDQDIPMQPSAELNTTRTWFSSVQATSTGFVGIPSCTWVLIRPEGTSGGFDRLRRPGGFDRPCWSPVDCTWVLIRPVQSGCNPKGEVRGGFHFSQYTKHSWLNMVHKLISISPQWL